MGFTLRAVTAFALLVLAWAKLLSGYQAHFSTARSVFWAVTLFETALAGLMFSRWWKAGAFGAMGLAAVGIASSLLVSAEPCGCLGDVAVGPRGRALLSGAVGVMASLTLLGVRRPGCRDGVV